jgi:hypothetical protein
MQIETDFSVSKYRQQEEYKRARARFLLKKHGGPEGFLNCGEFATWWLERFVEQDGCCAYCKTSIFQIRWLIDQGAIRTRKVGGNGYRGYNLELDRKNPDRGYSRQNCVLICYYCNNDKSYIYPADQYEQLFGAARRLHFESLAGALLNDKN